MISMSFFLLLKLYVFNISYLWIIDNESNY